MRNVIASEWIKLRRGGMLSALLGAIAITVLGAVIAISTAGSQSGGQHHLVSASALSIATLTGSGGLAAALGGAGTLLGIVVLGVVAASVAGEFSSGTLRNLLIREPRRARLLLGKLAALAIAIAAAVVIAVIVASAAAAIAASIQGYAIGSWVSLAGIGSVLVGTLQLIGSTLCWGVLGAALAIAFRSPVAAIGVGVVYAVPLESIIGGIGGVSRWLPGKLFSAIAAGGNSTASLTSAALTAIVYVVAAIAVSVWWFGRTDVAS
jgi:ABC-2 type transport system permease protein